MVFMETVSPPVVIVPSAKIQFPSLGRKNFIVTLRITFSPPFHYVMAKIVPVVQLAAHAKSSTLYGRTVVRSYNQMFLA